MKSLALFFTWFVVLGAPSMVWANSELPAPGHVGSVNYTGGEHMPPQHEVMQGDATRYPLEVQFLWGRGAKQTPVNATFWSIRNAAGVVVAMGSSSGPTVLTSLPKGRYIVSGIYDRDTVRRVVQVRTGVPNQILLEWPQ